MKQTDYSCGSFKINCAVNALPNFLVGIGIFWYNTQLNSWFPHTFSQCHPNTSSLAGPQHFGTVHFESRMSELESAYQDVCFVFYDIFRCYVNNLIFFLHVGFPRATCFTASHWNDNSILSWSNTFSSWKACCSVIYPICTISCEPKGIV